MPFPNEETTPPVTQINRVIKRHRRSELGIGIVSEVAAGRDHATALHDGRSVYRNDAGD